MPRFDEVVAYTYEADVWGPCCVVDAMRNHGLATPAAVDMPAEAVLDQCAGAQGIADRYDEDTFDSFDFPKVCFAEMLAPGDVCAGCEAPLG